MTLPTAVPALSLLCLALLAGCAIAPSSAKTGELTGTTVALARELAARAGVQARMIEYTAVNKLVEDAAAGVWDDAAGVGGDVKVAPPD